MIRYPALIDGGDEAYGVVIPDLLGIAAMGATIDEALINAEEVLCYYVLEAERDSVELTSDTPLDMVETPPRNHLASIRLTFQTGKKQVG